MAKPVAEQSSTGQRCAGCRFRLRDRAEHERAIPGLAVMGSAFGASIGQSRLCLRHDCLVLPDDSCPEYHSL